MKGLMGRFLKDEAALEHVRRAEPTAELENNYGEKVWTFREGEKGAQVEHGRGEDGPWW